MCIRDSSYAGPVLVHCITRKGLGYSLAENDVADNFHSIGVIDPETGQPLSAAGTSWTSVFSDEMVEIGAERSGDDDSGRSGQVRREVPRPHL